MGVLFLPEYGLGTGCKAVWRQVFKTELSICLVLSNGEAMSEQSPSMHAQMAKQCPSNDKAMNIYNYIQYK